MPNKDGTGPEGKGPMTGRKMGNCKGAVEDIVVRRRVEAGRIPQRRGR